MSVSPTVRWVLLALAGLLVAVAVAVIAAHLTSQRIGLASEPVQAGRSLAPPAPRERHGDSHAGDKPSHRGGSPTSAEPTTTTPPATTTTAPPVTTTAPAPPPETTTAPAPVEPTTSPESTTTGAEPEDPPESGGEAEHEGDD